MSFTLNTQYHIIHHVRKLYNTNRMFNYNRFKKYSYESSYNGYLSCGIMTKFIYDGLQNKPKVMISYVEDDDHVYLQYDNYIIDPTYKQMIIDGRDITSKYDDCMYNKLPPFFVGTKDELFSIYEKMILLNNRTFGYSNLDIDYIKLFWENSYDISNTYKSMVN